MTRPNILVTFVSRRCWPLSHPPRFSLGGGLQKANKIGGVQCAAKIFRSYWFFSGNGGAAGANQRSRFILPLRHF